MTLKQGFSLTELLIAVIVIGIIAAVAVPQYSISSERSRGGEAKSGLFRIQAGEKVYFAKNGEYLTTAIAADSMSPAEIGSLDIMLDQTNWKYTITSANKYQEHLITATRVSGLVANTTIMMDQDGHMGGSWQGAVDSL